MGAVSGPRQYGSTKIRRRSDRAAPHGCFFQCPRTIARLASDTYAIHSIARFEGEKPDFKWKR